MAGYRKKIAYLDYLENGMKMKNAGFVRLEENGGQVRLEMRVKNIPEIFSGQYELKADAGGVVGRISLLRGSGSCCVVWKKGGGAADGKKFVQADGVYVRLPGRHLLQAVWAEPMELCVEAESGEMSGDGRNGGALQDGGPEIVDVGRNVRQAGGPEIVDVGRSVCQDGGADDGPQREGTSEAEAAEAHPEERGAAEEAERHREELLVAEEPEPQRKERDASEEPVCYGDKWEQLTHMYPAIHPFGDEREYLSIAPKDFIVLRSEYQKMVHNSFLLHGYYNYRHLILEKVWENGECRYYLGVPGNFYGREKMVAEMFGFEAFEGEKEPAKAGDFGYFMKRVEI